MNENIFILTFLINFLFQYIKLLIKNVNLIKINIICFLVFNL